MDLIRINEAVEKYGVSSRTLRYYEEVGLLWSHHPDNKSQRYYDAAALERLKQIIVLRKLQIPVKDIAKIFNSQNMAALIQAFVDKLETLDTEITALGKLRTLVDEFLHTMLTNGIKKISAISLLYEETEKRLAKAGIDDAITFEKLSEANQAVFKLNEVRIIRLPATRALSSRHKTGQAEVLDGEKMQNLFAPYGFLPSPGLRDCFLRKEADDEWIMLIHIPTDYHNDTPYLDETLPGGLYAVSSTFFENLDDTFTQLQQWVIDHPHFQYDPTRSQMLEEIMPWDVVATVGNWQQDVFIPIK